MSQKEKYKGKFIWLVSWTCVPSVLRMALPTIGTLARCPGMGLLHSVRGLTSMGAERALERESTFDLWMCLSHALRMALPRVRHWLTALGMNLHLSDRGLMSMLAKQGGRKEFLQVSGVINQVLTHWIPSLRCHLGTVFGQVTPCLGSMLTVHLSLDKVHLMKDLLCSWLISLGFPILMIVNDRKMN